MASTFQLPGLFAAIGGRKPPKHIFEGHQRSIRSFVFLQDDHIVSGSSDGTMRKWNCETGLLVGGPWEGETPIYALALSPDGKTIACGRGDGTVERWDTNGEMMKEIWTGHSSWVSSVSWSPSGSEIASGSDDGKIFIRDVESGQVKLGWIHRNVKTVAYSPAPSDDRIASGGDTICIWDSHTGELLVSPIEGLGIWVTSVVWSLDGTKLYSASNECARVFDSTSATLLHSFPHDYLISIALSQNVLACVGLYGVVQLWDTESLQPLRHRVQEENTLYHVSFSPDGRHLAYGGDDNKITLWLVKDIALQFLEPTSSAGAEQGTLSQTPDAHAEDPLAQSAVGDVIQEAHDDPYNEFFASSQSSLQDPLPPSSSRPDNPRPFYSFLSRCIPSDSVPANTEHTKRTPKGKCKPENRNEEHDHIHLPANIPPDTAERSNDKGKQRETPIAPVKTTSPREPSSPDQLDSKGNRVLFKSLMGDQRKGSSSTPPAEITQDPCPKVVEVYAARGFKRLIALKRKSTAKAGASSQVNDDCDPDPRIQGCCNLFLERMCFPGGRFKVDESAAS